MCAQAGCSVRLKSIIESTRVSGGTSSNAVVYNYRLPLNIFPDKYWSMSATGSLPALSHQTRHIALQRLVLTQYDMEPILIVY